MQKPRQRSFTLPTASTALLVAFTLLTFLTLAGDVGASADTVTPDTHIKRSPSSVTKEAVATFRFASTEAGATFRCSLDRRPFRTCESPKTYRGLAGGDHRFRVRAVGVGGRADQRPASRSWKVVVEDAAPVVTIEGAPRIEGYHEYHYFEFSADLADSDFFCSLDDGPFAPCTSGAYRYVPYGVHTFSVYAVEPDGVRGETASVEFESRDPNWD